MNQQNPTQLSISSLRLQVLLACLLIALAHSFI